MPLRSNEPATGTETADGRAPDGAPDGAPDAATARALDLFVKLMRAQRAVTGVTEPSILASGLTVTQFGVLEALLHKGPLCHGDLQRKVLTSPANLSDVIDKLERRGLVTRGRAEADARRVRVHLTEAGRALIEGNFPTHAEAVRQAMRGLSAAEQATLACLLRKLGLAIEAETTR